MKIAFLFSGQGAQFPGMLKDLYDSEPAAKSVFDTADRALGREISALCFEGSQQELNLTHNTQPCVLAADLAAGMVLRAHGLASAPIRLAYPFAASQFAPVPSSSTRPDNARSISARSMRASELAQSAVASPFPASP